MAHLRIRSGEFTYADYLRWPEHERWQLLDGCAYAMAPPSLLHQQTVMELARQLGNQLLGQRCQALVGPVGVRLPVGAESDEFIRTVFEPDVLVVCDTAKLDARGVRGAPDFIIEVLSPSTASFDQVEKRQLYDRAGVRELWLIDVVGAVLTLYRREGGRFVAPEIVRCRGKREIAAIPGLCLDLDFIEMLTQREDDA